MSFMSENYVQAITHWMRSSTKDVYGKYTYSSPLVFLGRWEDKNELRTDIDGREIVARSRVWVPFDVSIGDYLMLGSFLPGDTDPTIVSGAFEVKDFVKVPGFDAVEFERKAFLA